MHVVAAFVAEIEGKLWFSAPGPSGRKRGVASGIQHDVSAPGPRAPRVPAPKVGVNLERCSLRNAPGPMRWTS